MNKFRTTAFLIFLVILTLACGGGGDGGGTTSTTPSPDTTDPSIPAGLTATPTANQISLSWSASTDNVEVAGYNIYRDGGILTFVTGTTYDDSGVTSGTSYCYKVSALDTSGNESPQSLESCAVALHYEEEPNNTPETATSIALDTAMNGDISFEQSDYFKFMNDTDRTVTITLNFAGGADLNLDLHLHDSLNVVLKSSYFSCPETITWDLVPGTYYIEVYARIASPDTSNFTYTLQITESP